MGGGMPIGAFVASSKIFQAFMYDPPLNHVTTFGGHPVSCAAAYANLKELLDGDYLSNARFIEQRVREVLKGDGIIEVRGKGAMLGLQLEEEKKMGPKRNSREPLKQEVKWRQIKKLRSR